MTVRNRRTATALAGLATAALAMTACGSQPTGPGGNDRIKVVASTSVWGSIAQAVGGDSVDVQSVISSPDADPHSYESTPQDAARISDADLVVFNGGGYDEFMEKALAAGGGQKPTVEAVTDEHEAPGPADGHGHDHSVNEHVWYDLHVVHDVADQIADQLGRIRPDQAARFHDAAAQFDQQVDGLRGKVDQVAAANAGKKVIVTEPVAHYLIEAAKLQDITPQSFVNAVEAENDPSAAAVADIQNAIGSRQASAVVHNPQTESPVTRDVRTAAERNHIPVVEMSETLPAGKTYLQWMDEQITSLQTALGQQH
ncbi:metal ABC transporter solute-binding protein, Zn/Mn family [Saccharopolyspora rosea]|uniref:Metal ABC transporter solute-binding protein, Zn/Mn family n=1 Tax=Saccharopolyspora rosea TaxID=524884 RepID=A0ABW3FPM3_9PSEU|nr:zinc ABC transporter substrate-binding protein [Saccharopolyspora rosea]